MTNLTALAPEFLTESMRGAVYATVDRSEEILSTETRNFDATDKKGRVIGARLMIVATTCVPVVREAGKGGAISQWVGTKYEARPHALRDGKGYGSFHRGKLHDTREAAEAAGRKYFAEAEKRASKIK